MDNVLFRKSSTDRLNSPEQLNEYIRVAKPGVWVLLAAIVLALLGMLAWGVFGTVETKVACGAMVENGRTLCYVGAADAEKIQPGNALVIGVTDGTVKSVSPSSVPFESEDAYLMRLCGLAAGEACRLVEIEAAGLEAGVYPVTITVESLRPIRFVIS